MNNNKYANLARNFKAEVFPIFPFYGAPPSSIISLLANLKPIITLNCLKFRYGTPNFSFETFKRVILYPVINGLFADGDVHDRDVVKTAGVAAGLGLIGRPRGCYFLFPNKMPHSLQVKRIKEATCDVFISFEILPFPVKELTNANFPINF